MYTFETSIVDFFRKLFNTSDFMPHGHCYFWRPEIVWLHVTSDALIALSYYSIPIALTYFAWKKKNLVFKPIFIMFGLFIFACGTTHLISVITIWSPSYRLDGVIKAVTALLSICTAVVLWPLIPKALSIPSHEDLETSLRNLDAAYKKLKANELQKEEFVSNVSHELRTPLTLIMGPVEEILSDPDIKMPERHRQGLQMAHNSSTQLLQIITGLLDYSQLNSEKFIVQREMLDLSTLTESMVEDFREFSEQKELTLQYQLLSSSRNFYVDRYLYERILFNLLSNAVKFTPPHGLIQVQLSIGNRELQLKIQDNGPGIPDSEVPKLFKRFSQVDGSATRRFEGVGLGLALIHEFTTLLKGSVHFENTQPNGCIFTVRLPVQNISSEVKASEKRELRKSKMIPRYFPQIEFKPNPPPEISAHSALPKVLIAEDNAVLTSYCKIILSPFCDIRIVENGVKALECISSWEPDLVITDIMMPEMDGYQLCREIKSNPKTNHILVVLLTALTHREAILKGWECGADEYLYKPFHPTELATRIRTILDASTERRKMERELRSSHSRLENMVQERTKDLSDAIESLHKEIEHRKEAETQIKSSLIEKEALLREIHHRVKNNLQIICSLLQLQSNYMTDSKEAAMLEECQNRVRSMALIHEKLYISKSIARIDFNEYIQDLVNILMRSYPLDPQLVQLSLEMDPIHVGIDAAIPLGLIVNELTTNALKHAFPNHRKGTITIHLKKQPNGLYQLVIMDNGKGLPSEFDLEKEGSMGISLVKILSKQLNGTLQVIKTNSHTGFEITLPLELS